MLDREKQPRPANSYYPYVIWRRALQPDEMCFLQNAQRALTLDVLAWEYSVPVMIVSSLTTSFPFLPVMAP